MKIVRWLFASLILTAISISNGFADQAYIVSYQTMPTGPIEIGIEEVNRVLTSLDWQVETRLGSGQPNNSIPKLEIYIAAFDPEQSKIEWPEAIKNMIPNQPESFATLFFPHEGGARVYGIGSDDVGTMYAAFEIAEQIELGGYRSLKTLKIEEKKLAPSILVRGINLLIHTQALEDRFSWFHSEDFWSGFLNTIAKARFNFLDLHGAFDLVSTQFPNLFPYFTYLSDYPQVGVGKIKSDLNKFSLRRIVEMANKRGINVSLMNYSVPWSIPQNPIPDTDQNTLSLYNSQALKQLLEDCPMLNGIGFRIGESGAEPDFFQEAFLKPLAQDQRKRPLFVRTWLTDPPALRNLIQSYPNNVVLEIKFNGDHLALPYPVTGGHMKEWHSHSYLDYFNQPRKYSILFELKANGTYRIFPWGDLTFIRRTLQCVNQYQAEGFSLETYSTGYPHVDAYSNTAVTDFRYYDWTYERDWYYFLMWGRLAYNPQESDQVFIRSFEYHFGEKAGRAIFNALQKISHVIPTITAALTSGPDKRSHAPEISPPLPVSEILKTKSFDSFSVRSIEEEADHLISGQADGRRSPLTLLSDIANEASQAASEMRTAVSEIRRPLAMNASNPKEMKAYREWESWTLDFQALEAMSRFYRDKASAAVNLGVFQKRGDLPSLIIATEKIQAASKAWTELCNYTTIHYHPFLETFLIGGSQFHWNQYPPNAERDIQDLTNAYQEWLTKKKWIQTLGHIPLRRSKPDQPLLLTVSIPPDANIGTLLVSYRNSVGTAGRVQMKSSNMQGVYYAQIPAEQVKPGVFEYYLFGTVNGVNLSVPSGEGGNAYTIIITDDTTPPRALGISHKINGSRNQVTVTGEFEDPSGIASVKLFWKPFPSYIEWKELTMTRRKEGVFTGDFPLTPAGAQYALEAIDEYGNAIRVPNSLNETPYRIIHPFN